MFLAIEQNKTSQATLPLASENREELHQNAEGVIASRGRVEKRRLGFLSLVDIQALRLTFKRRGHRGPCADHCCPTSSQEILIWTSITTVVDLLPGTAYARSRWDGAQGKAQPRRLWLDGTRRLGESPYLASVWLEGVRWSSVWLYWMNKKKGTEAASRGMLGCSTQSAQGCMTSPGHLKLQAASVAKVASEKVAVVQCYPETPQKP